MQLDKVNIGSWQNYQSFSDQEQIRLQRENFVYTGVCLKKDVDITFIYTTYLARLENVLEETAPLIKLKDTETIIADEVYYTTKIEGAKTTRIRTTELRNGAPISEDNAYSEYMVKNSFEAVRLLNVYGNKMSVDILIKVWNTLIDNCCDNEEIRGERFRSGPVYIGGHQGAPADQVPELMDKWVDFYNSSQLDEYPFLKASLLHFAFEVIHPFCDGNGRMGRLMMNNYLISRGIDAAKAVSFSMQINKTRPLYDAAFIRSENLYNDCTPFLEYMLETMASSFEYALTIQIKEQEHKEEELSLE